MTRPPTAAEDAAYLLERLALANRRWAVGDVVRSFRSGYDVPDSAIACIDGDIITLEDGTSGHVSRILSRRVTS